MNKKTVTGMGGLIAAGAGAFCCIGPPILASLGFGAGAIGFARDFGSLHLPLMVLAVLLLGTAFYLHRRDKDKARPGNAGKCAGPLYK
ncbi:MAG: hypothetical protein ACE5E9_13515 [Nitrospinaceae bacterium]